MRPIDMSRCIAAAMEAFNCDPRGCANSIGVLALMNQAGRVQYRHLSGCVNCEKDVARSNLIEVTRVFYIPGRGKKSRVSRIREKRSVHVAGSGLSTGRISAQNLLVPATAQACKSSNFSQAARPGCSILTRSGRCILTRGLDSAKQDQDSKSCALQGDQRSIRQPGRSHLHVSLLGL